MSLLAQCRADFSAETKRRGETYVRQGRIRRLHVEGRTADARVLGKRSRTYRVTVASPFARPTTLRASCTCPMGEMRVACKHMAAVLIALDGRGMDLGAASGRLRVEVQDSDEVSESIGSGRDEHDAPAGPPAAATTAPRIARRASTTRQQDWRSRLAGLAGPDVPAPRTAPPPPQAPLEYWLATRPASALSADTTMSVAIGRCTRRRDGTITARSGAMVDLDKLTPWLRDDDRACIELLRGCTPDLHRPYVGAYSTYGMYRSDGHSALTVPTYLRGASIYSAAVPRVCPALCATGRFGRLVDDATGVRRLEPIAWDADAPFALRLRATSIGTRARFVLELARGDEVLDPAQLELASTTHAVAGSRLIQFDGDGDRWRWLARLGGVPLELPMSDVPELLAAVLAGMSPPALNLDAIGWSSVVGVPVPRLYLEPSVTAGALVGRLVFGYGALEAAGADGGDLIDASGRRIVARDRTAETAARALLGSVPPARLRAREDADVVVDVEQLGAVAATLEAAGWQLFVRRGRVRSRGTLRTKVSSGIDWFDVSVEVASDGAAAAMPELLRALADGTPFVRLSDGTVLLLDAEWRAHQQRVAALGRTVDGAVRVPRAAAALLDAALTVQPATSPGGDASVVLDAAFRALRRRLAKATAIAPVAPPRGFRGALRPYQREGLGWFRFLAEVGLGGCLADDMGLGKTVQALALLAGLRRGRPSLVVAPKSVTHNWLDEARRFVPGLAVVDYTGNDRASRRAQLPAAGLIVTSYALLRRDQDELAALDFEYVILDEAQTIKNPKTGIAQAARRLRARRRLALTGTPVENHLGDLASILEFLNPGLLDASRALGALGASTAAAAPGELAPLARALRPFLLRRTKEQVLPDLPARTEQILQCPLGPEQRRLYDQLAAHYRAALLPKVKREGVAASAINVLAALLRLRQAACHPALVDGDRAGAASGKLDTLVEHLTAATESGHKALVFSQFTSLLGMVRARLDALGIAYEYLDGGTRDRKARVERFSADAGCRVFLVSLKAGGTGLNLVAADYVYLLDPWWNPAVEAQAIDRTHRIGQTRPVFGYRLIAENTVEDKILALQAQKRALAAGIFGEDAGSVGKLSAADLELLLS